MALERQRHPEAALGGIGHRLAVVMGEQNLGGHGRGHTLRRFWP
jgi:hypothetical protein